MSEHDETEPGTLTKATRFGCGALLGVGVGLYFLAKWTIMSFGLAAAIMIAAVCGCGYLAMKYGDEFWYALFDRDE
jgi:hypothetical protein